MTTSRIVLLPRRGVSSRGLPDGDHPAVVDDVDLVGEPLGLVHVVRGQHDRDAVARAAPRPAPRWRGGPAGRGRRSARRGTPARAGRRRPSRARAAAAGRRRAAGTACGRTTPSPSRSTSVGDGQRVRRAATATCRSISTARTPDQAPPCCSITPIRGDAARGARAAGRARARGRVPRLRPPVALAGLERGGLAGAVGAEDGGDRCRARRVRLSPSTAVLSPYRIDEVVDLDRGPGRRAASLGTVTVRSLGPGSHRRAAATRVPAQVRGALFEARPANNDTMVLWKSATTAHGCDVDDAPTRERVARADPRARPVAPRPRSPSGSALTPAAVRRHLDHLLAEGAVEAREPRVYGARGRGRPAKVFVLTDVRPRHVRPGRTTTSPPARCGSSRDRRRRRRSPTFARRRVAELEDALPRRSSRPPPRSDRAAGAGRGADPGRLRCVGPPARRSASSSASTTARSPTWPHEFPQLCEAETEVFSRLLGRHVQRLATIAHGDGVCTTNIPRRRPRHRRTSTVTAPRGRPHDRKDPA